MAGVALEGGSALMTEQRAATKSRHEVLLFGDSLTFLASQRHGWQTLLSKQCQHLNVFNRGCCGDNSRDGLFKVHSALAPATEGRLLATVWFGANDSVDSHLNRHQHVPLAEFKRNLAEIVHTIKAHFRHVIVLAPPPVHLPTYRAVFWRQNFGPTRPGQPMDRSLAMTEAYAQAAGEVAEIAGGYARDVHFINVWRYMQEVEPPAPRGICKQLRGSGLAPAQLRAVNGRADAEVPWRHFLLDGLHLSREGNELVFKLLIETIQRECPEVLTAAC